MSKYKNIAPTSHTLYLKLNGMINRCHKSKEGEKMESNQEDDDEEEN